MSGQGSQKVRRSSPISGSKQGPLKAILPVSSLMKKECNLKKSKSNSPTSSLKSRFSPDGSLSGQRSPGSLSYKGKYVCFDVNKIIKKLLSNIRKL